jgi:hypothetical protein
MFSYYRANGTPASSDEIHEIEFSNVFLCIYKGTYNNREPSQEEYKWDNTWRSATESAKRYGWINWYATHPYGAVYRVYKDKVTIL